MVDTTEPGTFIAGQKGKKIDNGRLRAMLAAEKANSLAAYSSSSSKLSNERARAMAYYEGDMQNDMPTAVGRSQAISSDVLDSVEGMMPGLMDIFTGGEEVVRFDPEGAEDVEAAQQETDYINHVFWEQNPGFMTLYTMIKDALISKTGTVKVWWETNTQREENTYYDLDDAQYALLEADPDIEILEHTIKDAPGHTGDQPYSDI